MLQLKSDYKPAGDQPQAIAGIVEALERGDKHHVLMGVTGSGKTFTMANVIARLQRPALVIAPNKTLAAQLFAEFKALFPEDHVGFFISYYDYYQPEAYVPSSDTYIAKDSSINDDIDKMRHETTRCLFEQQLSVIVASVSCIYGLGSPQAYARQVIHLESGADMDRDVFLRHLIRIRYGRNDRSLERGSFRVRGSVVDILPSHKSDEALRVEFWGGSVDALTLIDPLTGEVLREVEKAGIYPNSHYVPDRDDMKGIIGEVLGDLGTRLRDLKAQGRDVEAQRLEQRTMQDVETMEQLGYCPGIENYSRYLTGKKAGEPPPCLLDYFPDNFLTIIDESHITVPQLSGMYRGDQARKKILVDYGFRLPSAIDNRPLNFDEFLARAGQILHVSATPGRYELEASGGLYSEQIIRPTGLVDPFIVVKPGSGQVDDLLAEIKDCVSKGGRVLVASLTKRMAEDLSEYYRNLGIKVRYMHADVDSLARMDLLRGLRRGDFDVLIGINLLREGLDLPEVQLVAVLDADKEGFLRSRSSLIQVVGRAARNAKSKVVFYADRVTDSMAAAMDETKRRRELQLAYNQEHGIEPQTIIKALPTDLRVIYGLTEEGDLAGGQDVQARLEKLGVSDVRKLDQTIKKKTKEMHKTAGELNFERAAALRDEVNELKEMLMALEKDQ